MAPPSPGEARGRDVTSTSQPCSENTTLGSDCGVGQIQAQISAAKLTQTVTLARHLFPKPQLLNQKMGEQVSGVRFP